MLKETIVFQINKSLENIGSQGYIKFVKEVKGHHLEKFAIERLRNHTSQRLMRDTKESLLDDLELLHKIEHMLGI